MHVEVIDRRRGKARQFFLKAGTNDNKFLPEGMYLGLDSEGKEAILGEPSPIMYEEGGNHGKQVRGR